MSHYLIFVALLLAISSCALVPSDAAIAQRYKRDCLNDIADAKRLPRDVTFRFELGGTDGIVVFLERDGAVVEGIHCRGSIWGQTGAQP